MRFLDVYDKLIALKHRSEDGDSKLNPQEIDAVWNDFLETLPDESRRQARSFRKHLETNLRGYTNPKERLEKSIELFWQQIQSFQLTLSNPESLVARSQDGSRAVIIPIDNRRKKDE